MTAARTLKAIGEELDRAFEKLRGRAERAAHRSASEHARLTAAGRGAQPRDLACVVARVTRAGTAALAVLAAAALAPAAQATFAPPVPLATGKYVVNAAAATDASGTTTVVASGTTSGTLLYEHPAGGPWSAATALPGDRPGWPAPSSTPRATARWGSRGAWTCRATTRAIDVAMRDPGGTLGPSRFRSPAPRPGACAIPRSRSTRRGRAAGLPRRDQRQPTSIVRGGIAIAHRAAGGAFSQPTVVDTRPVERARGRARTPTGAGIVAWTHDHGVYGVSVDADGHLGKVKRIASRPARSPRSSRPPVGTERRRSRGSATTRSARGVPLRTSRDVRAIGRSGRAHLRGRRQPSRSTTDYVRSVRIAADDGGRVTLAWSREHFGDDHSIGTNGITSAVLATTATAGERFPAPRTVAAGGRTYRGTLALTAAAGGRVAMSWGFQAARNDFGVQAVVGPTGGARLPADPRPASPTCRTTAACRPASPRWPPPGSRPSSTSRASAKPPAVPVVRLLATDGF